MRPPRRLGDTTPTIGMGSPLSRSVVTTCQKHAVPASTRTIPTTGMGLGLSRLVVTTCPRHVALATTLTIPTTEMGLDRNRNTATTTTGIMGMAAVTVEAAASPLERGDSDSVFNSESKRSELPCGFSGMKSRNLVLRFLKQTVPTHLFSILTTTSRPLYCKRADLWQKYDYLAHLEY